MRGLCEATIDIKIHRKITQFYLTMFYGFHELLIISSLILRFSAICLTSSICNASFDSAVVPLVQYIVTSLRIFIATLSVWWGGGAGLPPAFELDLIILFWEYVKNENIECNEWIQILMIIGSCFLFACQVFYFTVLVKIKNCSMNTHVTMLTLKSALYEHLHLSNTEWKFNKQTIKVYMNNLSLFSTVKSIFYSPSTTL